MSQDQLLILLSPFFLIVLVFGLIVIVALCQAESKDVPTVFRDSLSIFKRLVEHLPVIKTLDAPPPDEDDKEEEPVSSFNPEEAQEENEIDIDAAGDE